MNNTPPLRIVAWELTRRCELNCRHCRAGASTEHDPLELNTAEALRVIKSLASFSRPLLILSGGDPILREDLFDLIQAARDAGLKVVMAPTGANLNPEIAQKIKRAGVERLSISLDGASEKSHDSFRGKPGVFNLIMKGVDFIREAGLSFQVNTTVTKANITEVPEIYDLARKLGAQAFHIFLLVPVGRGENLRDWEISPQEYEKTLLWIAEKEKEGALELKATCAPHYYRILKQKGIPPRNPGGQGCLGGKSYAFISARGQVQICGYLPLPAGDLRKNDFDFPSIWTGSELFRAVREVDSYQGKCGICEYNKICGGCRARAFAFSGNYLGEEPFCLYQPKPATGSRRL
ncbi:MAG: radical SAM protein [Proteobacteria bacterium]|nr:radical SAM protein [Pseudomonadota bacterium]